MTRLCVSVPVHEQLPVVVDQVQNLRAWLPDDTVIVLHLSKGFSDFRRLDAMLPAGVYVNDVSLETAWGDVLSTHNSNFRFITQRESFDTFVMHASNDMYIAPGAIDYISGAPMGLQLTPVHPYIENCPDLPAGHNPRDIACNDASLQAMAAKLDAPVLHTQPEGIWFQRELFAEMLEMIDLFWTNGERSLIAPEHFYYATVAAALCSDSRLPLTYSEAHHATMRHPITSSLIEAVRKREYVEDVPGESNMPAHYDYDNIFAVKRVPRIFCDPLRRHIRTLSRQHAARTKLMAPDSLSRFVCLTFAEEILAAPATLSQLASDLDGVDDACVLIYIPESSAQSSVAGLERLADANGLDDGKGANVIAIVLPDDIETHVMLAGVADVVCSNAALPDFFEETLTVAPQYAERVRLIADRVLAQPLN